MRRALALLLSLAMLFALAGCAAPAQAEPQQTAQAPADAAENPGTDVQPATAPKLDGYKRQEHVLRFAREKRLHFCAPAFTRRAIAVQFEGDDPGIIHVQAWFPVD